MKAIFSHPTGNQNSRNVGLALKKNEMLAHFYTTLGVFSDSFLNKLNFPILNEVQRRSYDISLKSHTSFFPNSELMRLFLVKTNINKLFYSDRFDSLKVYELFDKSISRDFLKYHADVIYGYGACSLDSFKVAKENGLRTIYDLPALHWRKIQTILENEKAINPEWSETLSGLNYTEEFLSRCDEELMLADNIIVASEFARDSLKTFPGKLSKIEIIPYGFPKSCENIERKERKKIKILFVGAINQQKGVSYLFDAIKPFIKFIELTIIGSLPAKVPLNMALEIKKHNYIGTMSHERVLSVMRESDLLIFPSIMDAFGMVISESMSQGTPVIATTSSAGPDLIDHNENGWIVETSNSEQIKVILEEILQKNQLTEISENALEKSKIYSWANYQENVCKLMKSFGK
jgi:glycosyltransferase involved in cell wall biosynthesis